MKCVSPSVSSWRPLTAGLVVLAALCTLHTAPAQAALADEIQVYTDDIGAPGDFGVELHIITFPHGRRTPDYAGEKLTDHSLYVTPELSWGLTPTWEVGLYLPTLRDGETGHFYSAGAKGRLKWVPKRADEGSGDWFAGANLEVARLGRKFSESRTAAELRIMSGWRNADWLLAANPVFGWELSDGASRKPDYGVQLKGTRRVAAGLAAGLEYYSERGQIGQTLPWNEQDNKLFVVLDVDRKPWVFNVGIGKALTDVGEKRIFKIIFEEPF